MNRFIVFLVRKKLGLKKFQHFKFIGQKSDAVYWFTESNIMKRWHNQTTLSGVSLNWLIDSECEVEVVKYD